MEGESMASNFLGWGYGEGFRDRLWRAISWVGVMARDSGTGYGERFPGVGLWRGILGRVMASSS